MLVIPIILLIGFSCAWVFVVIRLSKAFGTNVKHELERLDAAVTMRDAAVKDLSDSVRSVNQNLAASISAITTSVEALESSLQSDRSIEVTGEFEVTDGGVNLRETFPIDTGPLLREISETWGIRALPQGVRHLRPRSLRQYLAKGGVDEVTARTELLRDYLEEVLRKNRDRSGHRNIYVGLTRARADSETWTFWSKREGDQGFHIAWVSGKTTSTPGLSSPVERSREPLRQLEEC